MPDAKYKLMQQIDELYGKINKDRTTAELKSSDPVIRAAAQAAIDGYLAQAAALRAQLAAIV